MPSADVSSTLPTTDDVEKIYLLNSQELLQLVRINSLDERAAHLSLEEITSKH